MEIGRLEAVVLLDGLSVDVVFVLVVSLAAEGGLLVEVKEHVDLDKGKATCSCWVISTY